MIPVDWQSRSHFLGVAARQMRRFLVDHSRQKRAEKRDFGIKVSWEDAAVASSAVSPEHEFDTIDQLLTLLAAKDPDAAKVVELKFFGGLTDKEAAHYMNVNVTKVRRDWEFARGWLRLRLPGRARANAARA